MFELRMNAISSVEIAEFLGKKLHGNNIIVYGPSNISNISDNSIVFVHPDRKIPVKDLEQHQEVLVLTSIDLGEETSFSYIITDSPVQDMIRIINEFFVQVCKTGIDKRAIIEEGTTLGERISIGANCYIGHNVKIGDDTIILHNTVITGRVNIGRNCIIKSNSTLGSEGFGFYYSGDRYNHFPQVGGIRIGDNVWVGSNSTIETGSIDNTYIGDGTKIDDLVQIGHSCVIGANSIIAAGTILCGQVKIGRKCWLAPNVTILERVVVGDNALIGLGAVVIRDVEQDTVVAGNPARLIKRKQIK